MSKLECVPISTLFKAPCSGAARPHRASEHCCRGLKSFGSIALSLTALRKESSGWYNDLYYTLLCKHSCTWVSTVLFKKHATQDSQLCVCVLLEQGILLLSSFLCYWEKENLSLPILHPHPSLYPLPPPCQLNKDNCSLFASCSVWAWNQNVSFFFLFFFVLMLLAEIEVLLMCASMGSRYAVRGKRQLSCTTTSLFKVHFSDIFNGDSRDSWSSCFCESTLPGTFSPSTRSTFLFPLLSVFELKNILQRNIALFLSGGSDVFKDTL